MALSITHTTVASDPQTPLLDHTDWNANHAISGTKADFNAACTDGNFMYEGDAPTAHTHTMSDVTGLAAALADKSDVGHGHIIADVSGLQAALDGKQPIATKLTNFAAATGVDIEGDHVRLPAITTNPSTPAADGLKLFGRKIANKCLPAFIGPSGLDTSLNPHFGRNKIGHVSGAGNGTTITNFGILTNSATGTATAHNVATTNIYTQMRKLEYLVTVAATNAVAGFRKNALQEWNQKGYHFICQWGPATGVSTATARAFVGMRGSVSAPTDVNPSTLVDIIGMGWDDADTNIQVMHNDASGTATKIDLGSNFPVPTSDRAEVYEIALFAVPNGDVHYEVTRLSTGNKATGTISTNKPSQTQLMTVLGYTSVGGTSSVTGIGFVHYYLETDY